MQRLGQTRSSYQRDHLLQTPDTFIRAPLPGMWNATAIVHAGPAMGAAFAEYTVELAEDGNFELGAAQSLVYVIAGEVSLEVDSILYPMRSSQYAYLPGEVRGRVIAGVEPARVAVIEKPYVPLNGASPQFFIGDERIVLPWPLGGDESLEVRALLPDEPSFDFAVNTMTFQPGATLPTVEIHVMEHGLLMLEGEGIYRLGNYWYPVKAGDFIWMAPYCPQWFGALGKEPTKYLIFKDWNRHPLHAR